MSITYPISFPDLGIAEITLRGRSATAVAQSPFTLSRQVQVFTGQRWEADVAFPIFNAVQAGAIETFLLALNGRQGTFLLGDPLRSTARGSVASGTVGTPLVDGAGQVGATLQTKGWSANRINVLLAGDFIQLGSSTAPRLHKVLHDVSSDADGKADLILWPALRESPADNDLIVTQNCKGLFALDESVVSWAIDRNNFYTAGLTAIEVI
jgi:hypothetical protein